MRKIFSILGLILTCVLAQAAAVNWTNYVPNIQVATNANVANQLQLGTTFTDGHLWPNAPDGTTPWYLEHTVPHTGGNLFQLVDPLGPYFAITWLWEIQGADLLLTGSAQVQGTVRANNLVATNNVAILPVTLTPVDAGVSLSFVSGMQSITLTGAVTFTSANMSAGKTLRLRVLNPQATNCAFTWPANWTNWLGAPKPGAITAYKVAEMEATSWGTTDADVYTKYAELP